MFANDYFGSIEYKYHIISDMDKIIGKKYDSCMIKQHKPRFCRILRMGG